jgi:nucleotide-binding universal stress UspA family protein
MITKILVPTDFSSCAKNAVKYAAQLAKKLKAELTLYHVYTIPVVDPAVPGAAYESMMEEVESSAGKSLSKLTRSLQKEFPSLTIKSKNQSGFPITGILDLAKRSKFNLIVMGTQFQQSAVIAMDRDLGRTFADAAHALLEAGAARLV